MAGGRYIPPALRGKVQGDDNNKADDSNDQADTAASSRLYSKEEIAAHFGYPVTNNTDPTDRVDREAAGESTEGDEARQQSSAVRGQGTLNSTYAEQDKLAYIMLYHLQHPFWKDKREIFCKSNIDLLPPSETSQDKDKDSDIDRSKEKEKSYPVFTQRRSSKARYARSMGFDGYYRIESVKYLEPESKELVEYLTAKFGDRPRGPDAWKKSLSMKWAVVTLSPDEARKDEGSHIPAAAPQKSVNDMLADLRRK
jgi:hypothetical protein